MRFARCQQRTDDTHADGRLMVSTEQVVLSTQCDWSDGIFSQIVINMDTSVLQIPHHVLPAGIGVGPVNVYAAHGYGPVLWAGAEMIRFHA